MLGVSASALVTAAAAAAAAAAASEPSSAMSENCNGEQSQARKQSAASSKESLSPPVVTLPPSSDSSGNDNVDDLLQVHSSSSTAKQKRRDMFGDCALVEIIHLHDCLRGALHALEKDLIDLSQNILNTDEAVGASNDNAGGNDQQQQLQQQPEHQQQQRLKQFLALSELESRATARFQVIWSVFRAHSAAEDEFIWPALRLKTQGLIQGCCGSSNNDPTSVDLHGTGSGSVPAPSPQPDSNSNSDADQCCGGAKPNCKKEYDSCEDELVEQEEYEEDHADEERMFTMMDHLLARLRKGLLHQRKKYQHMQQHDSITLKTSTTSYNNRDSITDTMKEIQSLVKTLNQHLMVHLEKEEKQCMPLVVKHLSKSEIHDLVGKIMGKRSSDMIAQILTMAVQNLNETDKEEMVKHMKQAMVGTFFDRWLAASGWMDGIHGNGNAKGGKEGASTIQSKRAASPPSPTASDAKRLKSTDAAAPETATESLPGDDITSQAELEKLIRAVATNPSLTAVEKNTTIQGLRTSVWKRNRRVTGNFAPLGNSGASIPASNTRPPTAYYHKNDQGETVLVWKASPSIGGNTEKGSDDVPMFSEPELEPTFHDGANTSQVLGCAHYARACKIRHPLSGRLYTCRLCCDQEREASVGDKDEPLDRYAVSEVSCMKCSTLQPAAKDCVNGECELHKKGFAKYYCDICHLYDDRPRPIFHCPYCNTCRSGHGLGIDYRHCMRCNACVSLSDKNHHCIPQKLQGSCPICHETLFSSTEPLKGLRCGHVMHLSCFTDYRRGQNYTCPLCMRCMEDMSDYFSLLDQAVRMQTMPAMYQNTYCNLYCQDCDKTGQCKYHFVGQKCPHCGSYNTREMGRFESSSGVN